MSYKTSAIANYFISKSREQDVPISPMKLQKLVYFAHGWYLSLTGKPLINEQIEAWPYGPVVPSIYHEFKQFGSSPIKNPFIECGFENDSIQMYEPTIAGDNELEEFLDKIWEVYSGFSAIQLSNMTHAAGTPWSQTFGGGATRKGTDIPDDTIKSYFNGLRAKNA